MLLGQLVGMGHYDDRLLGYLATPLEDGVDILSKGYVASMAWGRREPPPGHDKCHTSRKEVPFSETRPEAVARMLKFRSTCKYALLLEIRRTPDSSEHADDPDRIDDAQLTCRGIRLRAEDGQVLHRKFIHTGEFLSRDHQGQPCPFCQEEPLIDLDPAAPDAALRRSVGVAVYACPSASPALLGLDIPFFLASPCSREACLVAMQARQKRLCEGAVRTLYHACSRHTASKIRMCGGKFLRGSHGAAGGGIYFAHTPRECWWKAEDDGGPRRWWEARKQPEWRRDGYAFLECTVQTGRELQTGAWATHLTFKDLLPYDSVVLDRGHTGYPVPDPPVIKETVDGGYRHYSTGSMLAAGTMLATRVEDVIAGKARYTHPGYEFIVYSWDQVLSIRELPHEEIDPPPGW